MSHVHNVTNSGQHYHFMVSMTLKNNLLSVTSKSVFERVTCIDYSNLFLILHEWVYICMCQWVSVKVKLLSSKCFSPSPSQEAISACLPDSLPSGLSQWASKNRVLLTIASTHTHTQTHRGLIECKKHPGNVCLISQHPGHCSGWDHFPL